MIWVAFDRPTEGVLDRPDIDVVSIVTPDHWHVKIAIEALQAGKHVFYQKPLSLTLEENQLAREAAERFPTQQFFIGTQQRSQKDQFLRAVNMVHKGLLGDVTKVTENDSEAVDAASVNPWAGVTFRCSRRRSHPPVARRRCRLRACKASQPARPRRAGGD